MKYIEYLNVFIYGIIFGVGLIGGTRDIYALLGKEFDKSKDPVFTLVAFCILCALAVAGYINSIKMKE
jgi:hypothetical protein